jgi:soluble lytic murein transglycosylase-like protein
MSSRWYVVGLVLFAISSSPARADIYGYVDENGNAHFSDRQIDSRYKLYMKTPPPAAAASSEGPSSPATPTAAVAVQAPKARARYADLVARVAREQQVDPALLHAVITVESGYNPNARSPKGATGLMQLMPDTAKRYGVSDMLDPQENLRGGARYLRDLAAMFNNNLRLVIAAYNAGEGAVIRAGRAIPPYPETRAYVQRVLQHYQPSRNRTRI